LHRREDGPEVGEIYEKEIPVSNPSGKIKLRVYKPTPEQAKVDVKAAAGQRPPVYINYHGGGQSRKPL
jgi:acetyl esterase/lipase